MFGLICISAIIKMECKSFFVLVGTRFFCQAKMCYFLSAMAYLAWPKQTVWTRSFAGWQRASISFFLDNLVGLWKASSSFEGPTSAKVDADALAKFIFIFFALALCWQNPFHPVLFCFKRNLRLFHDFLPFSEELQRRRLALSDLRWTKKRCI